MKSASLCELMECAESVFRANAELAPSRDEKPAKEQFFPFDYCGERHYLPKEEIGACNRLIGYCNAYNSAYNAPLLQFKLQIVGNHVKEVRMLGAAIAPSALLDLPALEKLNLPWSPSGYPFPSNRILKDLANEGILVVVGGKSDSGLAEMAEPQAGEHTAVSERKNPKTGQPYYLLRSVVNMSERYYENSAQPVEVKNALDRVKSILEPLEKDGSISRHSHLPVLIDAKDFELIMSSVNSYEKQYKHTGLEHKVAGGENQHAQGRADRWFVNSCMATVGLCFAVAVGMFGHQFYKSRTSAQEEPKSDFPLITLSDGSKAYLVKKENLIILENLTVNGRTYLIPKYEYDAYNELKQYSPKIEIGGKNERVVSVEMSKKGLKEVPDKAYVFYDVQKIDLSENQITKLIDIIYRQRTSDKWYPKFEKDIPYAECDTVKADYFKGLNSLKELNLANNPIDWNDPDNKGVLQRLEARGVKVYR